MYSIGKFYCWSCEGSFRNRWGRVDHRKAIGENWHLFHLFLEVKLAHRHKKAPRFGTRGEENSRKGFNLIKVVNKRCLEAADGVYDSHEE